MCEVCSYCVMILKLSWGNRSVEDKKQQWNDLEVVIRQYVYLPNFLYIPVLISILFVSFETGSHYVALLVLELTT